MVDSSSFQNLKINYDKLEKLGFKKVGDYYKYDTMIMNNEFILSVIIDNTNIVTSKVIEVSSNEEYTLYNVTSSNGNYVGQMREEYCKIIEKVKNTCSQTNVFKSEEGVLVIDYIKKKYDDDLEFLWEKFSDTAITRNKINNKWYALLMIVDKTKIGLEEEGKIEIIDLRIQKEKLEKLIDNKIYFAGYHMNKKSWLTIKLDKTVDIEEIYQLIDNSYNLSLSK